MTQQIEQFEAKNGLSADDLIHRDFIDRIGKGFFSEPYPGYPTVRYHDPLFRSGDTIPDGPWSTGLYGDTPTPTEREALQHLAKDILGRPLHPWLSDMVRHPQAGVVTGKGFYWRWGPNNTADSVVLTAEDRPRLLLIQRKDTGTWALPGGFIDVKDASPQSAAARELYEEACLLLDPSHGEIVYSGVVADRRTTAHAWAETTATRFIIPEIRFVHGGDDAAAARWFYVDEVDDVLFGSHHAIVQIALSR